MSKTKYRNMVLVLLIVMITTSLFLTSCGKKEEEKKTAEGSNSTTLENIYRSEAYGIYVMKGDKLYPLQSDLNGVNNGSLFDNSSTGFFWWMDITSEGKTIPHYIPTLDDDSNLVAVYNWSKDMPTEYMLNRFENLGYTVGGKFQIEEDGQSIDMLKNESLRETDYANIIGSLDQEVIPIDKISGKEPPLNNIDIDTGIMKGFQKHKYYEFDIYLGTTLKRATLHADTVAFKQIDALVLENPITRTRNQYFIVNIPENIENGYYTINNMGLFRVKRTRKTVEEDAVTEQADSANTENAKDAKTENSTSAKTEKSNKKKDSEAEETKKREIKEKSTDQS